MRLLPLCLLLATPAAHAVLDTSPPDIDYPVLPERVATLDALPPTEWKQEYRADGDLDGDGRADAVVVLRMTAERNIVDNDGLGERRYDTNPRLLAVALAQADGSWRIVAQDHALIPRPESPVLDDYLGGPDAIAVTPRGTFTVTLNSWSSAGSWYAGHTRFTFRWQDGCATLIGYDDYSFHRGSGEETTLSVNYLTAKAIERKDPGEDAEGVHPITETQPAVRRPAACLQDVGDGFQFTPLADN